MTSVTYTFAEEDQVEQTDLYTLYVAPYSKDTLWKEYHYAFYDSENNKLPVHLDVYQKHENKLFLYDRVIPYSDFDGTFYEPLPSARNQLYFKVCIKPCQISMFRLYLDGDFLK
jgi:hypothetical protein